MTAAYLQEYRMSKVSKHNNVNTKYVLGFWASCNDIKVEYQLDLHSGLSRLSEDVIGWRHIFL